MLRLPPCQISSSIQPRASGYSPRVKNTHHTIWEVIFSLRRKTPLPGARLAEVFSEGEFRIQRKEGNVPWIHHIPYGSPLASPWFYPPAGNIRCCRQGRGCGRGSGQHHSCSLWAGLDLNPSYLEEKDKTNEDAEPLVISHN